MTIAVDFDGTIVEHRYPEIGKELPFATATLKKLTDDGHRLILWSVREGDLLQEAVDWCRERGVRFHAVNGYFDEDAVDAAENAKRNPHFSRKLKVDCFIDDRNVGGLPDWGSIYQIISRRITFEQLLQEEAHDMEPEPKKRPWWKF